MPDESGMSQLPSALQQLLGSYRHSGADFGNPSQGTTQTFTRERKRIQPLVAKKLRLHIKTGETDFYSQGPNVLAAPKADLSAQPLL